MITSQIGSALIRKISVKAASDHRSVYKGDTRIPDLSIISFRKNIFWSLQEESKMFSMSLLNCRPCFELESKRSRQCFPSMSAYQNLNILAGRPNLDIWGPLLLVLLEN